MPSLLCVGLGQWPFEIVADCQALAGHREGKKKRLDGRTCVYFVYSNIIKPMSNEKKLNTCLQEAEKRCSTKIIDLINYSARDKQEAI